MPFLRISPLEWCLARGLIGEVCTNLCFSSLDYSNRVQPGIVLIK